MFLARRLPPPRPPRPERRRTPKPGELFRARRRLRPVPQSAPPATPARPAPCRASPCGTAMFPNANVRFSSMLTPVGEDRRPAVAEHQRQALREPFAFADGDHAILIFFQAVDHFRRTPR